MIAGRTLALGTFVPLRPLALLALLAPIAACKPSAPPSPSQDVAVTETTQADPSATPITPLTPNARTEDEKNTIAVFKSASASTVFVTQTRTVVDYLAGTAQEVPAGSGSGFVWDKDGHIVTNFHVVDKAESLTVTFGNQQTFEAKLIGTEPRKDIAVLKVDAPADLLTPINVPKHMDLEVGEKTIAIGNPFGLDHTLTTGVVSAIGRQVQGIGGVAIRDMIQTDAAINPGNSGGPLLDSSGEVIGMNTMIFSKSGSSAGIGFAVPVSTIARVVPQIVKNGHADQLGIGINIDPLQRLERRNGIKGVVVLAVPQGTPADKAGIRGITQTRRGIELGDVIVGIGDHEVNDFDELYNALDAHKAGDIVDVKVRRGDKIVPLKTNVVVITP